MHPSAILAEHGIEPKKSLGQNFLYDEGILQRIVDAAGVTPADEVLEIGAGLGSLTRLLAAAAGRVVALELDERLVPILRLTADLHERVELVHGDVLDFQPADWFSAARTYKVVANVPYYITGAILEHLLSQPVKPSIMALTMQKDVAERIIASPPDMSILAVSVQFYGRPEIAFNISPGSFWPRPKVSSSVLVVDLQERDPAAARVADEAAFFRLVKAGFSQKRKQLHNNLRGLGFDKPAVAGWLRRAGIDGRRRAQTLELAEWVALYEGAPERPL